MKRDNHSFHFKQFSVRHDRCAMKVGTDGVLLGAWADADNAYSVLDIGTGSGVIALMLAQRTPADAAIDAVEILQDDASQATENATCSPWTQKVSVHHLPFANLPHKKKYDLIVSNPPYFIESTSPPSNTRKQARHTEGLTPADLLKGVCERLKDSGKFAVILPTTEGNIFQKKARDAGLHCKRKLAFYSRAEKPQERWLLEFVTSPVHAIAESVLVLYGDGDNWSDEYKELMKDFYLAL